MVAVNNTAYGEALSRFIRFKRCLYKAILDGNYADNADK
jgi:hypothetical protein